MKITPNDINADGIKILVKLGGLKMPLSDDMVKKYCGHLPKTEIRARAMVDRLRGRELEFPDNISFDKQKRKVKTLTGNRDNPEYRRGRIERKKRRERNVMKLSITLKLDGALKKSEIFNNILEIPGVLNIKTLNETTLVIETERRMDNKTYGQKEINETIIKMLENNFEGIKEVVGIDYQDVK